MVCSLARHLFHSTSKLGAKVDRLTYIGSIHVLHHLLCSCPLLKSCSFPITCLILSLLDRPHNALQAKARMQSASTSGVFTISRDSSTLIPLLARTQPHILDRMSSLLLYAGRDFAWNFATAPLTCNTFSVWELT